jgi:hypothetical protein
MKLVRITLILLLSLALSLSGFVGGRRRRPQGQRTAAKHTSPAWRTVPRLGVDGIPSHPVRAHYSD